MKVWINGCFDVLHYGHFRLINYARSYGGELVIGIDSDRRIKESKGEDRPIHTAEQRKYNLLQLLGVSDVWVFDTDEELDELIKNYQPDLFVIGDEYKYKPIIGYTHVKEVKFFEKIKNISTSKIIKDEK